MSFFPKLGYIVALPPGTRLEASELNELGSTFGGAAVVIGLHGRPTVVIETDQHVTLTPEGARVSEAVFDIFARRAQVE